MDNQAVEDIEIELAILLRRVALITSSSRASNFDRSAYLLIHHIITNGPTGVKVMADELQLDISTVSRQAAALERKGYVYRITDPSDGRAYFLQITDLGVKEFYRYKQARLASIEKLLGNWSNEDRTVFGQLLRKFNYSLMNI